MEIHSKQIQGQNDLMFKIDLIVWKFNMIRKNR